MIDLMSVDFGIESLVDLCGQGLILAEQMLEAARRSVARLVTAWRASTDAGLLETHQAREPMGYRLASHLCRGAAAERCDWAQ